MKTAYNNHCFEECGGWSKICLYFSNDWKMASDIFAFWVKKIDCVPSFKPLVAEECNFGDPTAPPYEFGGACTSLQWVQFHVLESISALLVLPRRGWKCKLGEIWKRDECSRSTFVLAECRSRTHFPGGTTRVCAIWRYASMETLCGANLLGILFIL